MGSERPHDRLIAAAAREILAPLGFRRKGRSRLWFADHEWWLIVVEFQPSSWSRGAYLNVAAKWLWSPALFWSFDFSFDPSARVSDFREFESEEQFRGASRELANAAAAEAGRLREAFPSISAVADRLGTRASVRGHPWDLYHAAVAAFLAGRATEARTLFTQLSVPRPDDPPGADWLRELRATADTFATLTGDRRRLIEVLSDQVRRSRTALRLPQVNEHLPGASV